jgi:hypothetical protein
VGPLAGALVPIHMCNTLTLTPHCLSLACAALAKYTCWWWPLFPSIAFCCCQRPVSLFVRAHSDFSKGGIPKQRTSSRSTADLYWLLRSSVQKKDLASRMRRMRSVSVGGGRFTCRLRITSCWRKSAFSAISRDLLLRRSVRVPAARRSRRFGPTSKARGERIQAAILQPLESGENTTHSRSFSIA